MPTSTITADDLRAHLDLQLGERLYGVVDAAQDKELAFEAEEKYGYRIRSLFQGPLADSMRDVAPYMVPIDPKSDYLESWAAKWGHNVGILLVTKADPIKLWKHLREIFVVQDESGQEYFFRFYDPRVLRTYLPTCTFADTRQFLGPILSLASHDSKIDSTIHHYVCS